MTARSSIDQTLSSTANRHAEQMIQELELLRRLPGAKLLQALSLLGDNGIGHQCRALQSHPHVRRVGQRSGDIREWVIADRGPTYSTASNCCSIGRERHWVRGIGTALPSFWGAMAPLTG